MIDIDKEIIVRNVRHMDDYFDADIIKEFEDTQVEDDGSMGVSVQEATDEEMFDSPEPGDVENDWDSWEEVDIGL